MGGDAIIRERHRAVERIWLNRPEVENCLNNAIYDALSRALEVGLVQQVLPDAGFHDAVMQLAERIASRRLGDSLARVKALTVPREPSLADREL